VAETLGQFGNTEKAECPPLEVVTRRLAKRDSRLRRLSACSNELLNA
jgi:hypothetical protein